MNIRDEERALDAALHRRLAADEGAAPPVAERDLDLGPYTIRTRSNRAFDYAAPRPESIVFDDLVAGLVGEPRYASQVPRHYSVAEHLVLATRIAEVIEPGASQEALLAVLMHDAAEAFCKDLPGPLKRLIGEPYRVIERAVEAAVFARFNVVFEPHRALVKACDRLAYLTERRVLCGWGDVSLPGELGVLVDRAVRDDMAGRYRSALARALPWRDGPKIPTGYLFRIRFNQLGGVEDPDHRVEMEDCHGPVAEPSTAEEYETLTEAPSTYEALLNGADAIDARRKGGV